MPNGRPRFRNRFDFLGSLPEKTEHAIQVIYLVTVGEGTGNREVGTEGENSRAELQTPAESTSQRALPPPRAREAKPHRSTEGTIYLHKQTGEKKQSPF